MLGISPLLHLNPCKITNLYCTTWQPRSYAPRREGGRSIFQTTQTPRTVSSAFILFRTDNVLTPLLRLSFSLIRRRSSFLRASSSCCFFQVLALFSLSFPCFSIFSVTTDKSHPNYDEIILNLLSRRFHVQLKGSDAYISRSKSLHRNKNLPDVPKKWIRRQGTNSKISICILEPKFHVEHDLRNKNTEIQLLLIYLNFFFTLVPGNLNCPVIRKTIFYVSQIAHYAMILVGFSTDHRSFPILCCLKC